MTAPVPTNLDSLRAAYHDAAAELAAFEMQHGLDPLELPPYSPGELNDLAEAAGFERDHWRAFVGLAVEEARLERCKTALRADVESQQAAADEHQAAKAAFAAIAPAFESVRERLGLAEDSLARARSSVQNCKLAIAHIDAKVRRLRDRIGKA